MSGPRSTSPERYGGTCRLCGAGLHVYAGRGASGAKSEDATSENNNILDGNLAESFANTDCLPVSTPLSHPCMICGRTSINNRACRAGRSARQSGVQHCERLRGAMEQ